jgi:putative peptidoglycan lipid II flippase
VATVLFWALLAVSALGVVAAPVLVWRWLGARGRAGAFDGRGLMTRWMFPYICFMSMVALAAGVLNTWRSSSRCRHSRRCC